MGNFTRTYRPWVLAAFIGLVFSTSARGAPPHPKGPDRGPELAPLQSLKVIPGRVAELTKNKPGDVDGFKLESGQQVHFPPHHGKAISGLIQQGTDVCVFASVKSRPDGKEFMEVVVLQIGEEAIMITGAMTKPLSKPDEEHAQPAKPNESSMSASGKIASFHKNHDGDVDGFELDDKTIVKFPPHEGGKVESSVRVGSAIIVRGRRHETPKGDVHLQAERIVNGDQILVIEGPKPKPPNHDDPKPDRVGKSK